MCTIRIRALLLPSSTDERLRINSTYTWDKLRWTYTLSAVFLKLSNFGKTWASRRNIWDASATPSGIKREWYVCIEQMFQTTFLRYKVQRRRRHFVSSTGALLQEIELLCPVAAIRHLPIGTQSQATVYPLHMRGLCLRSSVNNVACVFNWRLLIPNTVWLATSMSGGSNWIQKRREGWFHIHWWLVSNTIRKSVRLCSAYT
jgi:hypothetical protein